jgi:hypothetical protein
MSKEQRKAIEEHVRKVLSEDLKQKNVSQAVVREVAEKVFKAIPAATIKEKKAA